MSLATMPIIVNLTKSWQPPIHGNHKNYGRKNKSWQQLTMLWQQLTMLWQQCCGNKEHYPG